jgi:hypothetical protein
MILYRNKAEDIYFDILIFLYSKHYSKDIITYYSNIVKEKIPKKYILIYLSTTKKLIRKLTF